MRVYNTEMYSKSIIALSFMILMVNLGETFNVFGIKLSWIAALLLIFIFVMENQKIGFYNRSLSNWFKFFMFWLIYGTIQMVFVKNQSLALSWYMILFINVFISGFMLILIRNHKDFNLIMNTFSLSFMINILAGYWEIFTNNHIAVDPDKVAGYKGKAAGFLGNFNDFGSIFLFMSIVIFLIQFKISKKLFSKIVYIAFILLSGYLIKVNGSRGGIYSVLLLFLLFIPFYIYEKWINDKKTRVLLHLVAIMIVFSIGFYILQKFSYQELVEFLGSSGDYGSDLYRVRLIMGGVKAFIQSAFLGIGPGQSIAINSMNIHNFYFEILAEYGIFIGIGAFLISFIIPYRSDRHNPPYINALFKATAVALILASVSSSSTVKMRAYWVFIILILIIKKKNILQESNDMQ